MSDNTFIISVLIWLTFCGIVFGGDPDLVDVVIKYIGGLNG